MRFFLASFRRLWCVQSGSGTVQDESGGCFSIKRLAMVQRVAKGEKERVLWQIPELALVVD